MSYTVTLLPTGAGTYTELTPSTGANWECMNDSVDTDYVRNNGVGSYKQDLYALEDMPVLNPGDVITKITLNWRARRGATSGPVAKPMIRSGASEAYGAEQTLGSAWTSYADDFTTDPATGVAWTVAAINALEAGVAINAASSRTGDSAYVQIVVAVTPWPGYSYAKAVGALIY
jgi:hypothetical protein